MTRPTFYTVREVTDMLQISRTTLYRITKAGELYSMRVGAMVRYPAEALDAYRAGERYDPEAGALIARADVSTWPPTRSLLADDGYRSEGDA